ncbi:tetratricopeptide repeat protein [bacterium]|nr:tetratricopeptide repeat protein [candidate division CSSED10-310 bacterium]
MKTDPSADEILDFGKAAPHRKQMDRTILLWIFLTALLIRTVWIVQYQQSPLFNYPLLDFTFFEARAQEINEGRFFSDTYLFNPLYPFFLAGVQRVFGADLFFPRLIQVVLGSFNPLLVYCIGLFAFSRISARFGAFLTAVYLPLVYFDGILMATSLITFLMLAVTCLLIYARNSTREWLYLPIGILMGFLVLGRPNFLLVMAGLTLWIVVSEPQANIYRRINRALIFACSAFVIVSPITIHYWLQNGEFILVAPHGGINFFIGNNPDATGTYMSIPGVSDLPGQQIIDSQKKASEALGHEASASEASQYWMDRSIEFIRNHPSRFAGLLVRKIALFWNATEIPSEYSFHFDREFHSVLRLPFPNFGWIGPLGLLGIVIGHFFRRHCWRERILPIGISFLLMVSVILFFVHARYRMAVTPFICLFAGVTLETAITNWRMKQFKNLSLIGLALIPAFYFCHLDLVPRNDLPGYFNLANAYYQARNLKDAEKCLRYILTRSETLSTWMFWGTIQQEAGKNKQAEAAYKRALQLDPNHYEAMLNLAILCTQSNRQPEAVAWLEKAENMYPNRPEAILNLAMLFYSCDKSEQAISCLARLSDMEMDLAMRGQVDHLQSLVERKIRISGVEQNQQHQEKERRPD